MTRRTAGHSDRRVGQEVYGQRSTAGGARRRRMASPGGAPPCGREAAATCRKAAVGQHRHDGQVQVAFDPPAQVGAGRGGGPPEGVAGRPPGRPAGSMPGRSAPSRPLARARSALAAWPGCRSGQRAAPGPARDQRDQSRTCGKTVMRCRPKVAMFSGAGRTRAHHRWAVARRAASSAADMRPRLAAGRQRPGHHPTDQPFRRLPRPATAARSRDNVDWGDERTPARRAASGPLEPRPQHDHRGDRGPGRGRRWAEQPQAEHELTPDRQPAATPEIARGHRGRAPSKPPGSGPGPGRHRAGVSGPIPGAPESPARTGPATAACPRPPSNTPPKLRARRMTLSNHLS